MESSYSFGRFQSDRGSFQALDAVTEKVHLPKLRLVLQEQQVVVK